MYIDFSKYSDIEIKFMVNQCFKTIEQTGIWDKKSYIYGEWIKIKEEGFYISVSDFLRELYYEFATRFNLHRHYNEYLRDELSKI